MNICPVCQWPLNGRQELKTHMEIKHPQMEKDVMPTTKRFAHVRQLVSMRNLIAHYPTNVDGILRNAIFDALPTQYADVCRFVKSHDGEIPSSMISTAFRIAQNHASSILNELWQFGLLDRTADGNRFLYS